jgi:hypothetical protein
LGDLKRLLLCLLVCVGIASRAWAETAVFVPTHGYMRPSLVEGNQKGREVSAVFQNPARLATITDLQTKIESSNDYFGYDDLSLSFATRTSGEVALGIGYQWFGTTGIPKVTRVAGDLPTTQGTFAHDFRRVSFSVAQYVTPKLAVGVSAQQMYQRLASDYAIGASGDFGFYYQASDYVWFGAYTRYLTSSDFTWAHSGVRESFTPGLNIESGLDLYPYYLRFMADQDFARVLCEWGLNTTLSLQLDSVWNATYEHQRMGYGAILELGPVALSFLQLHYTQSDFGLDQNYVGVLYRFGGL